MVISIHAPREGSDFSLLSLDLTSRISIHAPREGSDLFRRDVFGDLYISIHAPREGSDSCPPGFSHTGWYFYPRSPRGERRRLKHLDVVQVEISIHAPREGSDMDLVEMLRMITYISIHAPREGSDHEGLAADIAYMADFYPRSPRGERP